MLDWTRNDWSMKMNESSRVEDKKLQGNNNSDQSVYDAMVSMAQDFNKKYPLINGHGNFGSIDGDTAAAMRYTEAKLSSIGELMLQDIDKDTVDFITNYDETELEPKVLPTLFPQLLANGTSGIAVSVSTSFAPHKVSDIYKALDLMLDNAINEKETSIEDLIDIIQAPDFPTGGIIVNSKKELSDIYKTGKGKIIISSKYNIEEIDNKVCIIISEIPYKVNKSKLICQIDDLRKTSLTSEIKEVRDESDKNIRIVIELKKNTNYEYVIKVLLKKTLMQSSYLIEHNALHNGEPCQNLNLKDLLEIFLLHAIEVIRRKIAHQLSNSSSRKEIVDGIIISLNNLDTTINIIRTSKNDEAAINSLINVLKLNNNQAKAIVNSKLSYLTQSSINKYKDEQNNLQNKIDKYTTILNDKICLLTETKNSLLEISRCFNKEKRITEISNNNVISNVDDKKDLIKNESIIVTFSNNGIIKAVKEKEYKSQNRGGTGSQATKLQEEDTIINLLKLNTVDDLLFFTNTGYCYTLPAYMLPISNKNNIGRYIKNFISLLDNERIVNILSLSDKDKNKQIFVVTSKGLIKQMTPEVARSKRGNRNKVATLLPNDSIASVLFVKPEDEIILFSKNGFATRIKTDKIRTSGKASRGIKGMKLSDDDKVISSVIVNNDEKLLLVSSSGYIKRCNFSNFNTVNRGAKGVIAYRCKNDCVAAVATVSDNDDAFIITKNNKIIRISVETISCISRSGRGVKGIKLSSSDNVIGIAITQKQKQEDEENYE